MSLVAEPLVGCVFHEDRDVVPHRVSVQLVMFFVDNADELGTFGVGEVLNETLDHRVQGASFLFFLSHGGSLAERTRGGKGSPSPCEPMTTRSAVARLLRIAPLVARSGSPLFDEALDECERFVGDLAPAGVDRQ